MDEINIDLDIKKLKEEDRRFLLNKTLNEVMLHHNASMHNVAITLSLFSLLVSLNVLLYSIKNYLFAFYFTIFSTISLIFYWIKYKKSQKSLKEKRFILRSFHNDLSKYHFSYAKKMKS